VLEQDGEMLLGRPFPLCLSPTRGNPNSIIPFLLPWTFFFTLFRLFRNRPFDTCTLPRLVPNITDPDPTGFEEFFLIHFSKFLAVVVATAQPSNESGGGFDRELYPPRQCDPVVKRAYFAALPPISGVSTSTYFWYLTANSHPTRKAKYRESPITFHFSPHLVRWRHIGRLLLTLLFTRLLLEEYSISGWSLVIYIPQLKGLICRWRSSIPLVSYPVFHASYCTLDLPASP